jgi:uncharacterized protein (DUF1778 family)
LHRILEQRFSDSLTLQAADIAGIHAFAALARADEALADRRHFCLNAAQWKSFMAALDAPARPLPRLERLLKEPGFFDAGQNQ